MNLADYYIRLCVWLTFLGFFCSISDDLASRVIYVLAVSYFCVSLSIIYVRQRFSVLSSCQSLTLCTLNFFFLFFPSQLEIEMQRMKQTSLFIDNGFLGSGLSLSSFLFSLFQCIMYS